MKKTLNLQGLKAGAAAGIGIAGASELILWLTGRIYIICKNDIHNFIGCAFLTVLYILVQEIVLRGIAYNVLKNRFSAPLAMITTGAFFLAFNIPIISGAVPLLNLLVFNILLCVLYENTCSLSAPLIAHMIWRLLSGNILGILPNITDKPSLLKTMMLGCDNISSSFSMLAISTTILIITIFCHKPKEGAHNTTE